MEKAYIVDLKDNEKITSGFMIKQATVKTANNNKKYMDFTLMDKTGEINAKLWEYPVDADDYIEGVIVKIAGTTNDYKGTLQLKINKIRLVNEEDEIATMDYVKTAPIDGNTMYDFIMSKVEEIEDEDIKKLTKTIYEDNKEKLLYFPAAMKNHHAVMGGLLYHVKRMVKMAERMIEVYPIIRKDYLYCGVLLHDIAKLMEMDSNEYGIVKGYTVEGNLLGHIIQGIKLVEKYAEKLDIDEEKSLLIQHMILSHHSEPEYGSPKRPMIIEAEMLHYIDNIDAKIFDMTEAIENVEPGEFSDRIWTMDNRKLYQSNEK